MASKSKAGLGREERESYLRQNGFSPVRNGKGSHEMWEHDAMRAYAQQNRKLAIPETMKAAIWQVVLCSNPGFGTWQSVVKQVEWVNKTLSDAKQRQKNFDSARSIKAEFNKKANMYDMWKKAVRQELKAGIAISASTPPVSYFEVRDLQAMKHAYKATMSRGF